jgi:hypothetical protein
LFVWFGFSVKNGFQRSIVSSCVAKQQAQNSYDDAISENKSAVLLHQNRESFCLSIGNLQPHESCKVTAELDHDELTTTDDGNLVVELPYTTLGISSLDLFFDDLVNPNVECTSSHAIDVVGNHVRYKSSSSVTIGSEMRLLVRNHSLAKQDVFSVSLQEFKGEICAEGFFICLFVCFFCFSLCVIFVSVCYRSRLC